MKFSIPFSAMGATKATWMILIHFEFDELDPMLETIDECFAEHENVKVGPFGRLRAQGGLTGQHCEVTILKDFPHIAAKHLAIVGLGCAEAVTVERLIEALNEAISHIATKASQTVAMALPYQCLQSINEEVIAQSVATAFLEFFGQHPNSKPFTSVQIGGLSISDTNKQAIIRSQQAFP